MNYSPRELLLRSLTSGPVRPGLVTKEKAYEGLKKLTGEDFGYDVGKWREWDRAHPEVDEWEMAVDEEVREVQRERRLRRERGQPPVTLEEIWADSNPDLDDGAEKGTGTIIEPI